MRDIKAVIFDMDGLMLDSEPIALGSLRRAGASIGLNFTDEMLMGCIGLNEAASNAFLSRMLGRKIPSAELSRAFHADYEATIARDGIPLKTGLVSLLAHLEDTGIRRAVATSTATALAQRKLAQAGVLHQFEFVVGGDAVRQGKPSPDPYLLAADRLNLNVEHCLALEDSDNGVRSALAANMKAIIVPDLKTPADELVRQALACLTSLDEVREYLVRACSSARPE